MPLVDPSTFPPVATDVPPVDDPDEPDDDGDDTPDDAEPVAKKRGRK